MLSACRPAIARSLIAESDTSACTFGLEVHADVSQTAIKDRRLCQDNARVHIMSSPMTFGDYMVVLASGMPGGSEAGAAHRSQYEHCAAHASLRTTLVTNVAFRWLWP